MFTQFTSKAVARPSDESNLSKAMLLIGQMTGTASQVTIITDAIERDHEDLKKFIKLLKDEDTSATIKRKIYGQFASLLQSHANSEEKAMYVLSEKLPGLKQKTLEGYVEHQVASTLAKKIKAEPTTKELPGWLAQVQVLAELVLHHVEEEESDLLPVVKKEMSARMQAASCQKFVKLRKSSQRNKTPENSGVLAVN
jgi:hemerythrin-like domain-containing protein